VDGFEVPAEESLQRSRSRPGKSLALAIAGIVIKNFYASCGGSTRKPRPGSTSTSCSTTTPPTSLHFDVTDDKWATSESHLIELKKYLSLFSFAIRSRSA
jgi:hypothetical protein